MTDALRNMTAAADVSCFVVVMRRQPAPSGFLNDRPVRFLPARRVTVVPSSSVVVSFTPHTLCHSILPSTLTEGRSVTSLL